MWFENITKDLGDFTNSLVEDTKSLANMVTRLAAEVAGGENGGNIYFAGDEDSLLAQECPLDEAAIHKLQRDDAVYLAELRDEEEKKLFEEWARRSVYSSANIHQQDSTEKSASSSDETAIVYRQRLLDENPVVCEKFMAFVQQGGPSLRKQRSETGEQEEASKVSGEASSSSNNNNNDNDNNNNSTNSSSSVKSPMKGTEPLPESKRITEDVFFDRYFFRLSQLRLHTNRERRKREEEQAAAAEALSAANPTTAASHSSKDEPAKKKKSFAERLIEATDELVGWDDEDDNNDNNNNDNNGMDAAGNRNSGGAGGLRGDAKGNNSGRTETEWREQEKKITLLESLVSELQEELSTARRRVTAVLTAARECGIAEEYIQRLEAAAAQTSSQLLSSSSSPDKGEGKKKSTKAVDSQLPSETAKGGSPQKEEGEAAKSTDKADNNNNNSNNDNNKNNQKSEVDGADKEVLPEEEPQRVESMSDHPSHKSESSSMDNDGWTNV
ncbi:uncharacterized protein TM35_000332010 [Trypanosoma theileri]|uniref:Uncharacterized protein n=1 Tax=Trypanosoma theileri TaxID=67003 RepID=A0A1X0NLY0_9TRYP|nr:uncharacterized protein TM35_000332010 [Trypanosoma theileri]ORC85744.1 hypothetical protein TM35_000332010 [Trypanosoma theileri]